MAASYPGPVSAVQVGSYFVGQYYQVLQQHPDLVHQFYADASTMIRIDGDSSESASTMLQIHTLVTTLNFTAIEIKTINSLDSWTGGVLVMVSGSVKTKDFGSRRKFVQSFFLAPQEKGFFVLNDIFQFVEEQRIYEPHPAPVSTENIYQQHPVSLSSENIYQQHPASLSSENIYQQHPAPISSESAIDTQLNASNRLSEPPVSNYVLEEEAREYVTSVHIEDDTVDKYSLPEQHQEQEFENEVVVEETPVEDTAASFQAAVNAAQDSSAATPEEPLEEPPKKTYASILLHSKGQISSSVPAQPSVNKSAPPTSDWNHVPAPATQQSDSGWSFVSESGIEAAEEGYGGDEGVSKSVYVKNLPSNVSSAEIEQEFKYFGKIRPNGVFIKNRQDVPGVCYAFVEFEDLLGVQNALKSSPIQLAGRSVYIEERRPNSSVASRGGRGGGRGRGRGGYQTDAPRGRVGARSSGRVSNQDGGDYNKSFYRGSR